ncbi:MAG TPA: excalibur calcium-binding domain-containing protein [Actinomycetes bacterium]|nr:excalibur calcium-binding domain-containing protein [Actinomycetes bacterium]
MRRTIVLLTAAVVLALWATPASAQDDQNCADFPSQAAAQAHLRQDPSDPDRLDADDDGLACENYLNYPEGSARDETPVGTATGGGDTGGGNGDLPFTGPNDTLLPAGTVLLALGLLAVAATRYRGRHARR